MFRAGPGSGIRRLAAWGYGLSDVEAIVVVGWLVKK
jgi:hypothetical protein